ncbi:MAG: GT-D fold domain-containing glycosyltransferase [Syntrophomonadaceae bacterium]|nr:GT-D fold domain-containing glycosyltransferase [Syntrophomonadaceae bacterium]
MDSEHTPKLSIGKGSLKFDSKSNSLLPNRSNASESIYSTPSANNTPPETHHESPQCPLNLSSMQLMDRILSALENKEPLSIVSVGQTEAFVMAQYTLFPEEEFMRHREAYNANLGAQSGFLHRGIRFPNIMARDAAVEASRQADIIGYNTLEPNAKNLTERVFGAYRIEPRYIFEANIRRVFMFSQREKFEKILSKRKVLLVSSLAEKAMQVLNLQYQEKLGLDIVGAVSIFEHEDIPRVKNELTLYDFDLCLLGAGVNALILAPYIAQKYGKIAFDIGWGMQALITGEVVSDSFISDVIGLENLLDM